MHEDLVKSLRVCGDALEKAAFADYETCLYKQAADAIEELSKVTDAIPRVCECCIGCECEKETGGCDNAFVLSPSRAREHLSKPRWIPVTESLPEAFKHVLVNIPGMAPHPTVQEAFREKNEMWYSNGFRYAADEITHWMPLPTPPKEET